MKKILFFLLLTLLSSTTACGAKKSNDNYNNNYSTNTDITTNVTPQQKIINHLNSQGTGEYHQVVCSSYTTNGDSVLSFLGYKNGSFFLSNRRSGSSIIGIFSLMINYGASSGSGLYTIEYSGKTYFESYETIYIQNHTVSNVSVNSVPTCLFSDDALETVANLNNIAIRNALSDVNSYLLRNNLNYIY